MPLRDFDSYARPILFTYKGKGAFDTRIGGIFSITTSLLILMYGCQQIIYLFISPNYTTSSETTYVDFSENTQQFVLNTQDNTIAVKILDWKQ